MKRLSISRRTLLRGVSAAVALPLLEAMGPRGLASASVTPPVRMAFFYVPNGVHMPDWTPRSEGRGFDLPSILKPLESVKDDILVLSGLTLDQARAHGDGGGDHARAMASFLTGRHPLKTDGANLRAGISVDQAAAQKVGHLTRFPSLELGCEGGKNAGECDHGYSCAYQSNLSWSKESAPVAKQINPRLVFDRLFGNMNGGSGAENEARAARQRKSILDFVREDARRLGNELGSSDRRKLDEYLQGVREIERRVSLAAVPDGPGGLGYPRPLGIPLDYQEHVRLMGDLLTLAFQTDQTRIATLVFANDGSNRSYRNLGVADGHHDLSHHGGDQAKQEKIRKINQFHVDQLAYILRRLKRIPEGEGTLLDHSMILYGSGISDGNSHSHEELPILVAGRGDGSIKPGRHVRLPRETPLTNLYLSMLDRVGVSLPSFGDSTGRVAQMEG